MRKRLLLIILCIALALAFMPATASADTSTSSIILGTAGIDTQVTPRLVYLGYRGNPVEWWVMDKNNLLLLSRYLLGDIQYDSETIDGKPNTTYRWVGSVAQGWCQTFCNNSFAATEQSAIRDTAITASSSDKVFLLSTDDLWDYGAFFCCDYLGAGDDPVSLRYADGSPGDYWWLRTQVLPNYVIYYMDRTLGYNTGSKDSIHGARPALYLDPDSVLFTSAAEAGKVSGTVGAGALISNSVPTAVYNGKSEYAVYSLKLTLKDSNRSFDVAEVAAVGKTGGNITLHYDNSYSSEPADYTKEYISGMIADGSGSVLYYGNLAAVTQQNVSGAALTVTIPAALPEGSYTLKLFSEQCNGDKLTDYASTFSDVALTVDNTAPAVAISSAVSGPTNAAAIPVALTFSENVTGFDSGDLSVGNGTASSFGGSGTTYTAQITPASDGTVTVDIAAGAAQDAAGNANTAATQFSITSDKTAPAVSGVTNGGSYNTTVRPTFTEGTATLAKDGAAAGVYTSSTDISAGGSYVLKVTDAAGNCTTISFKVVKLAVGISCSKTDATLYGAADGSITVTASGGDSGTYEYSINGGSSWQASNVFGGLAANTYTAVVRDAANTGNTATCGVTVGQPALMGRVAANKVSSKANAGTAITVVPPAAPKGYTTTGVTYSSSNPSVATADANGNVTFLAGGKATIITKIVYQMTDKNGNIKTKTTTVKKTITVKQPVAAISLNLGNTTIARTQKVKLIPALAPATASNRKLKWTSSNNKVAAVSSAGMVTGKAGGTAMITCMATDGSGISASCTVTVTPIYPAGVKLNKTTLTLKAGKTASLKATISPKNTDFKTVTMASSNPSIATVDAKGKVKAISSGTAVVTAATSSGQTASCTVTVK